MRVQHIARDKFLNSITPGNIHVITNHLPTPSAEGCCKATTMALTSSKQKQSCKN